ncbi:hypothetical protein Tco_0622177 [Tanacetum coccineum]
MSTRLLSTTGDRNWKVESLCGYPFKCFLDAYKGYHQIQMAKDDEEKTAFHTSQEGMFLRYLIEPDGIKPCPEKTKAVIQLPSPRTMKEVQSLNGKLAGLNRFLSKSADKSLPLFKTLKKCTKKGDFRWIQSDRAFHASSSRIFSSTSHASRTPTRGGVDLYSIREHREISNSATDSTSFLSSPSYRKLRTKTGYFVSKATQGIGDQYSAM